MGAGRVAVAGLRTLSSAWSPPLRPERPRCPAPARGRCPRPPSGPLAPPRLAPRRASGSLAAAGARLQRQRGPPGFVSVGLGVFRPDSDSSTKRQGGTGGGHRPLAPPPRQGFPPLLAFLSGSPPQPSLLPVPSLPPLGSPGFSRVSRYCRCLGGAGGPR